MTDSDLPPAAPSGTPLGSAYLVQEQIGVGATGSVHRGTRRAGNETVAVKVLRPELAADPGVVARFVQERSILMSLSHPNLVAVQDLVAEGRTLAIVMDFVDGGDLRRLLDRDGPVAPDRAGELVAQVLDGLAAAHAGGVVHRDLKPENVLLELHGDGPPLARVTDFGIARIAHGPSFTRLSGVVGTPDYMAPEQAEGGDPTPAVDVYAAGILAYELMAGTTPFPDRHPVAVLRAHIDEMPRRPDGLPFAVWGVLGAMLAKAPGERPGAAEAAQALRAATAGLRQPLAPGSAAAPGSAPAQPGSAPAQPTGNTLLRGPIPSDPRGSTPAPGTVVTPAPDTPWPGTPPRHLVSASEDAPGLVGTRLRLDRVVVDPVEGAPPAPVPHRRKVLAGAVALVVIALAVGAFIAVRGHGTPAPASYAFPALQYPNGLVSTRVWTVTGGNAFEGTVGLTNGGGSPLTATVVEAIPKAIASSASSLTFDPSPTAILQSDPVVAYSVSVAAGATYQFHYRAHIAATAHALAELRAWAAEESAAAEAAGPSPGVTLTALSATPATLNLTAGQMAPLQVTGTMSDGSAASPAVLGTLVWTSSAPGVATVSAATVKAVQAGTATITGAAGGVHAAVAVAVAPAPQAVPPRSPAPPRASPSASHPAPSPGKSPPPSLTPSSPPPSSPPTGSTPTPSQKPTPSVTPPPLVRVPVYRLADSTSDDWFYTSLSSQVSIAESVGYTSGGMGFYGCSGPGSVYVYRLFYGGTATHYFTPSVSEESALVAAGFHTETPDFEGCPLDAPGVLPVYRLLYKPKGASFLTLSAREMSAAESYGWTYQEIAFYAFPPPGYAG
jgi:serine/threonine protein kinase